MWWRCWQPAYENRSHTCSFPVNISLINDRPPLPTTDVSGGPHPQSWLVSVCSFLKQIMVRPNLLLVSSNTSHLSYCVFSQRAKRPVALKSHFVAITAIPKQIKLVVVFGWWVIHSANSSLSTPNTTLVHAVNPVSKSYIIYFKPFILTVVQQFVWQRCVYSSGDAICTRL